MDNAAALTLPLRRQSLETDVSGRRVWRTVTETASWPARSTALVLCDVWDHHWCPAAEARLTRLLPRMQEVITTLRSRGVQIIHAPSETMTFYEGSAARRRVQLAPPLDPPPDMTHENPLLPIATPNGGCDSPGAVVASPWTRQHPAIAIDVSVDGVSDNGRELFAFYRERGVRHVLIMGVHTNMCILNRSFAIKQLARWGVAVALVRDLTDAMYDPADPPYVSHEEGTRLVVEYIEKFWCPTVESESLLASA